MLIDLTELVELGAGGRNKGKTGSAGAAGGAGDTEVILDIRILGGCVALIWVYNVLISRVFDS